MVRAFARAEGKQAEAARSLGISRSDFSYKLRKHGLLVPAAGKRLDAVFKILTRAPDAFEFSNALARYRCVLLPRSRISLGFPLIGVGEDLGTPLP